MQGARGGRVDQRAQVGGTRDALGGGEVDGGGGDGDDVQRGPKGVDWAQRATSVCCRMNERRLR